MRGSIVALAVAYGFTLLAASGCGKSTCEKYAEMEYRCGGYPASEESDTKMIAEAMCEGANMVDEPEARAITDRFKQEAACAARYLKSDHADCGGYKACTEAIETAEATERSDR